MDNCIYGVDLDKKFDAKQVRDALVKCFEVAHKEMVDKHASGSATEDKVIEMFKKYDVKIFIKDIFTQVGANFEKPTKDSLTKVVKTLASKMQSLGLRDSSTVKKHSSEIMKLISKL
jgi:hypothetical protein